MSRLRSFLCVLVLLLLSHSVTADIFDFDFNSDPSEFGLQFFGNAQWRPSNGFVNTGYLSVTDAVNGQRGAIVFPDLSGHALQAFSVEADLRVGGGTDRPADGFSFNFARPGDPVIETGEGYAASPAAENNLPEEGTTTGVAIGFDEWQSGPAGPPGDNNFDVVGMSVRLDNELVNQFPFPVLNGEVDDQESLQTGPRGVAPNEIQERMGWARLSVSFCGNRMQVTQRRRSVR